MKLIAAFALPLALAACFGGGGEVTTTVVCPPALVSVDEASPENRPERPARGEDRLADAYVYIEEVEAYVTAQELQARAREAQVAECRELAEDG